jgi:molybdopterin-containing oxidoreductase family membrane subunit
MWRLFYPTLWDWLILFGSLGFFAFLYLIFVRLFPVVSMHEVRKLVHEEASG